MQVLAVNIPVYAVGLWVSHRLQNLSSAQKYPTLEQVSGINFNVLNKYPTLGPVGGESLEMKSRISLPEGPSVGYYYDSLNIARHLDL